MVVDEIDRVLLIRSFGEWGKSPQWRGIGGVLYTIRACA